MCDYVEERPRYTFTIYKLYTPRDLNFDRCVLTIECVYMYGIYARAAELYWTLIRTGAD